MPGDENKKFYEEMLEEPEYLGAIMEEPEAEFPKPSYFKDWEEKKPPEGIFEKFAKIRRIALKNKKRIMLVFFSIYIIYAAILLYLLYFNFGIALGVSIGKGVVDVTIMNEASHTIKWIKVDFLADGRMQKSRSIGAILPGKKASLRFISELSAGSKIEVVASAPFHVSVKRVLEFSGAQQIKVRSTLEISDRKIAVDQDLHANLRLCNLGSELDTVVIAFNYDPIFESAGKEFTTISLQEDACRELPYTLRAIRTGKGNIYFNISAYDYNDKLQAAVEVVK